MASSGLSYKQLATAFRHRNFKPLYFLFGEEGFQIDQLQALLIEHAMEPHERDFNFDLVYGSDHEAAHVLGLCQGFPVMAERRVVVVREFEKLSGNRQFKAYAEQPNPHAVVFLACSGKPNLSAHPYRALKKHAAWAHFKALYDNKMPGWLSDHVAAKGYRIEREAVQMLADYVGTDLRAADSEIDKLIAFVGERDTITADDVLDASGQTREFNVFELQKALGQGRRDDAHRILTRILQQASTPQSEGIMIVAVLNSYVDKLWRLQDPDLARAHKNKIAGAIGVSPYFVGEYVAAAKRYSRGALERAYAALLAADYELKGGAVRDARVVLTLLLRHLVPPRRRVRRRSA